MSLHSVPPLLGGAPWSACDSLVIGCLVMLLLKVLSSNWKSPIPLGTMIGLVAGLLVGVVLEMVDPYGSGTGFNMRGTLIVGLAFGLVIGLIGKLLAMIFPNGLPATDQQQDNLTEK